MSRQTLYNRRWLSKPGNREKQRAYWRKHKQRRKEQESQQVRSLLQWAREK